MRKLIIAMIVFGTATFLVGYLWVSSVASSFMTTNQRASKEAADLIEIQCPRETSLISRPWGKTGWSVLCARGGMPHGPWFAVEAGRLEARGAYADGSRCGSWQWLSPDGSVLKREILTACSDSEVIQGLARERKPDDSGV